MPRLPKPIGGRKPTQTCVVRGEEGEGRKAVLRRDRNNTRIASIGPDGLTTNESKKVLTSDVLDIQPVDTSRDRSGGVIAGVVNERGTITIPSEIRRRHRLQTGSPYLIEDRGHEIVIRPAEIVPRQQQPLDELLAGITPENLHGEVSLGDPIGRETL